MSPFTKTHLWLSQNTSISPTHMQREVPLPPYMEMSKRGRMRYRARPCTAHTARNTRVGNRNAHKVTTSSLCRTSTPCCLSWKGLAISHITAHILTQKHAPSLPQ